MPGQGLPINGHAVEDIRNIRYLSQTELAEAAEISKSYLNEIERGARTSASPQVVRRLAEQLGVSPGTIVAATRNRVGKTAAAA